MFTTYMRRLRESRGLSYRDVAQRSGLSHTYVQLLETGRITNPSVDRLMALARVYGVTPQEIIARAYPDAYRSCGWEDVRRILMGVGYSAKEADERIRELQANPPSRREPELTAAVV